MGVFVAAVANFAQATGDLHSLSLVDLKLLALAYSLEKAAHGDCHLRKHPEQVVQCRVHRSNVFTLSLLQLAPVQ